MYFASGVPSTCLYELNQTVPSDAVFTDTKVTSAGNHYTPATDNTKALSVDASSTTSAEWDKTSLVTGVNLQRDTKGHVTGLTVDSIKMPINPNSDTKVTQNAKSDNVNYPLLGAYSGTPTSGIASSVIYDSGITLNPSTNTITAANFSGEATSAKTATKAT